MNSKKQLNVLLILVLLLSLTITGCKKGTAEDFDVYTNELAKQIVEESPLNATFMYSDLEKAGLPELLSKIDDMSSDELENMVTEAKDVLNHLDGINKKSLTTEQLQTYEMIVFQNQGIVDGEKFLYYENAFQPSSGVQINIPIALMQIELESETEVQAYIERCKQLPKLFEQYVDYENERLKNQIALPPSLYDAVLEEIDGMLVEPEAFMMYLSFCDRVDELDSLDDTKRSDYKAQYLEVVNSTIYPAYDTLISAIEVIKTQSENTMGLSEWKDSKDYYNYLVKYGTSYDMDAEDLRDWAQKQMEEAQTNITSYMEKHSEIVTNDDLMTLLPSVTTKEQMVQIEDDFISEAFLDYGVERASENTIPEYLEEHLPPAFYFPISLDGEDYGNMYMTEDALSNISISTLETDMHENLPGHHMYFSVLYGSDLPLIRKVYDFNAYVEGWAQYIQGKVYQYSATNEETAEFWKNLLQMQYAYSVMLDIQVNYDGISKEEAISKYLEMGYDNETAESAYNRMIANPAELIDYYYGSYVIEGYLEKCKKELGDKLDIKQFHDLILKHGGLTFKQLDDIVDDFIDQTNKK